MNSFFSLSISSRQIVQRKDPGEALLSIEDHQPPQLFLFHQLRRLFHILVLKTIDQIGRHRLPRPGPARIVADSPDVDIFIAEHADDAISVADRKNAEGVSALQIAVEGKGKHWISENRPLLESAVQKQTLPTWILMLVLLIGFIIIPTQVAEEKEKIAPGDATDADT